MLDNITEELQCDFKKIDEFNEKESIKSTLEQLRQEELERLKIGLPGLLSNNEKIFGHQWNKEK